VLSEVYSRVKRVIFINNQVRKYYGKEYHRQTSIGEGGGTQARLIARQARANQKRASESKAGIEPSSETKVKGE